MSRDSSTNTMFVPKRSSQLETRENELEAFHGSSMLPPPRTPLNSIPDPSQYQKETADLDFKHKHVSDRAHWPFDKRVEALDRAGSNAGSIYSTPKVLGRGKAHYESTSAQSTPARTSSRVSLGGPRGGNYNGSRGTRDLKGIHTPHAEFSVESSHFELEEDSSFWKENNVQVLIRIRPLNNLEKFSQGYGRCLRQESSKSLLWLGHPENRFTFDHVACETISQEKLFRVVGMPMVENCLSGYNSCMFAYGQTGSGKTYTMMGEINEVEDQLNEDCGITARVFDYLFARIRVDEESRRDEKLKYSCKCSFLEIYNEQITDLLEPSSSNLQLREDMKKGVYVENLTEYRVKTVQDVIMLLLQGTANRKIAATQMNDESSRSHSVFTCVMESSWEKDSMNHVRFARLNLVDLAGSERQKSSGAEGDRLKEAANINRSLSTLGLVIMTLVDLAHGRQRHVPYRDSRLTFLLQDSLGGNSKTMIIANVSPSISSSNETLSTLKFAQRAKLIQNNAKVNEDASDDVTALQRQIQFLKDQLSFLMERHNSSRSFLEDDHAFEIGTLNGLTDEHNKGHFSSNKADEKEEDSQCTNMILKLRDEKIQRLEMFVNDKISAEEFLMEENGALMKEIQLLRERIDNNPELTRLTLENSKLLQELQLYQNLYGHHNRENFPAESSDLRHQVLEGKLTAYGDTISQDLRDFQECQKMNFQLIREVEELRVELQRNLRCSQSSSDSLKDLSGMVDSEDELILNTQASDGFAQNLRASQSYNKSLDMRLCQIERELMNAKEFIEVQEAEQFRLIKELQHTKEENDQLKAISNKRDLEGQSPYQNGYESLKFVADEKKNTDIIMEGENREMKVLENKLGRILHELEEVKILNNQYEQEQASQVSRQEQVDLVFEQVEMETTRTILQLQEEVANLQLELHEKLTATNNENFRLRETIEAQQAEMKIISADWENATLELTNFLLDGSRSLKDVSRHIAGIAASYPQANAYIGEYVEQAAITCIEKEEKILLLQRSLENAQKTVFEMDQKLSSLKDAAIALSEFQHLFNEEISRDTIGSGMHLQEKLKIIKMQEDQIAEAEKRIFAAFLVIKWLSDDDGVIQRNSIEGITERVGPSTLICSSENKRVGECSGEIEIVTIAPHAVSSNEFDVLDHLIPGIKGEASDVSLQCEQLRRDNSLMTPSLGKSGSLLEIEIGSHMLQQIKDELREANCRLNAIKSRIDLKLGWKCVDEELIDPYEWSPSSCTSGSDSDSLVKKCDLNNSENACSSTPESVKGLKDSELPGPCYLQSQNSETGLTEELLDTLNMFYRQYVRLSVILDGPYKESNPFCEDINSKVTHSDEKLTAEAWCGTLGEEAATDKLKSAHNFLMRLEETSTTIDEANLVLNELTKANENAKHLTHTWKQTTEALISGRTSLIKEVEDLKISLYEKEKENELLKDIIDHAFVEVEESISFLKACSTQTQRDVDGMLKDVHADVLSMRQDVLNILCNSKSSVEDLYSEILEKSFAIFVLHEVYVERISMLPNLILEQGFQTFHHLERHQISQYATFYKGQNGPTIADEEGLKREDQSESWRKFNVERVPLYRDYDYADLVKELERKEVLLNGLLFDFALLQESASNTKIKLDETENRLLSLNMVQKEVDIKTCQLEEMIVQCREIEGRLACTEKDLNTTVSDLEQAKRTIENLSDQNMELRAVLNDLYLKKSKVEEQLDEQQEVIKGLEEEILHLTTPTDGKILSVEYKENELELLVRERDQLLDEVCSLNNKLHLAYSLADEKEAVAAEAQQVSEASKIHAEQKEEEIKILEHSIEELEHTVNMLEKKVYEMDQDMERHRRARDELESELQVLRQRMSVCENLRGNFDLENKDSVGNRDQLPWRARASLSELQEAHKQIKLLEHERAEQERQIKQYKEYISELVLHAEAQASQYQQKYKTLETMVHEVKADVSNPTSIGPSVDKNEKCPARTRGSSSPFRCISSIVQQMNMEKDQELSAAKHRVLELETVATRQQKEVCMLTTKLAAAENMTHDVIRDLLGVKLDITNYANFVEQHQVQELVEAAFQQQEDLQAKEQEVQNLRRQIDSLIGERESYILEAKRKESDVLAAQINLEQLQQRDQLLSAQNEMLKVDKSNLARRVAELDEMMKALFAAQDEQKPHQHRSTNRESNSSRPGISDIHKRLAQSENLLNRASDELARYRSPNRTYLHGRTHGNGSRR
ncbi:hypothetical protein SAY86_015291 [Trapa natans]|uniref:Kinesin motor domain-containing protein n=1 Tax=Trapa natans TaxID=22666 RepID=A0AAN7KNV5_TRANT|nr:hypothetical protein SAY86_015291 [Trapa natans]